MDTITDKLLFWPLLHYVHYTNVFCLELKLAKPELNIFISSSSFKKIWLWILKASGVVEFRGRKVDKKTPFPTEVTRSSRLSQSDRSSNSGCSWGWWLSALELRVAEKASHHYPVQEESRYIWMTAECSVFHSTTTKHSGRYFKR